MQWVSQDFPSIICSMGKFYLYEKMILSGLTDILRLGRANMVREEAISADMEFFTEESYAEYLKKKSPVHNERLRGNNETIFDALSSDQADFLKDPEYKDVVSIIQNYNG